MTVSDKQASSILLAGLLLLVPVAIWAEDARPDIWNSSLFASSDKSEPNRHTPRITTGTYLPPQITADTTYTSADSPLIITTQTRIPAGTTVTIEDGVNIYTHEFARLDIEGALIIAGTENKPVTITTNELHPENRPWSGLVFKENSRGSIKHAEIKYATPGVSCLAGSSIAVSNSRIAQGLIAAYIESSNCTIQNSRLQAQQEGIISRKATPILENVSISSGKQSIKAIDKTELP